MYTIVRYEYIFYLYTYYYNIGNKYDLFKTLPIIERRSIIQVMRMFAHYHGASLLTSSLSEPSIKDHYRHAMDSICFPTLSVPTPAPSQPSNIQGDNTVENKVAVVSSSYIVARGMSVTYEAGIDKPVYISAGKVSLTAYCIMHIWSIVFYIVYTLIYTLYYAMYVCNATY